MGWFDWSKDGESGKGNNESLAAGQRSGGGNYWTRDDGSSGRSVTRDNGDGTSTNHIVETTPDGHATKCDHTFTNDGRDVSSDSGRVRK